MPVKSYLCFSFLIISLTISFLSLYSLGCIMSKQNQLTSSILNNKLKPNCLEYYAVNNGFYMNHHIFNVTPESFQFLTVSIRIHNVFVKDTSNNIKINSHHHFSIFDKHDEFFRSTELSFLIILLLLNKNRENFKDYIVMTGYNNTKLIWKKFVQTLTVISSKYNVYVDLILLTFRGNNSQLSF